MAQIGPNDTIAVSTSLDSLLAPQIPTGPDSLRVLFPEADTVPFRQEAFRTDSVFSPTNNMSFDFSATTPQTDFSQVELSADSLDAPVTYSARDSMIYDIKNEQIHLHGDAKIAYQNINLNAGYIVLNYGSNIVTAEMGTDSLGRPAGEPQFSEGDQTFSANRMRYNFKTRKGIIYDVSTTQSDLFVRGRRSKLVGADPRDSLSNDIIYSEGAIFTSCDHDEPHFGIRSSKQKVIPNKLVVVGPSNLEIMGIPTPLVLPFAFFPISQQAQQGLIFPQDYEYSDEWGFGLRDLGYYFPINDNMDFTLRGDIYLKGSWGLSGTYNFNRRYRYQGSVSLGYARRRQEVRGEVSFNPSFAIRASLNQAAAAHPAIKISGNINLQGNNYQRVNQNDVRSVLQNQISSNLNFTHTFPNHPFTFSASFNHSQNTQTREMRINFPNLNFQTQTLYPFKRRKPVGPERWYERVAFQYRGEAQNRFVTTDTTLFDQTTLDNAQLGARHRMDANTNFRVLKYFNLSPSANYEETWHFRRLEYDFDANPLVNQDTIFNPDDSLSFIIQTDTTAYGQINVDTLRGFSTVRQFTTALSLNTQIFGTLLFRKGWLRGVRHVIKPSLSLNYTPDYTDPGLGYFQYLPQDSRFPDELDEFSTFRGNIYNGPSSGGQQFSLGYSITNIFEGKYFSRKDSVDKKFKLFDNIYIRGNYNFARDSLKWSQVNASGTTRLFDGISTMNFQATWDPYDVDVTESGRQFRVDRFYRERTGQFLRFVNAQVRVNTTLTVAKIRGLLRGKNTDDLPEEDESGRPVEREDDLLSLFENFRLSHNLVVQLTRQTTGDTLFVSTNSLAMSGNVKLTDKWAVRVGNFGYDFQRESITYPDFGFSRNLHCWELAFSWQPVRNVYALTLQVSPGSPLSFIKVPYKRNNQDGVFEGF